MEAWQEPICNRPAYCEQRARGLVSLYAAASRNRELRGVVCDLEKAVSKTSNDLAGVGVRVKILLPSRRESQPRGAQGTAWSVQERNS